MLKLPLLAVLPVVLATSPQRRSPLLAVVPVVLATSPLKKSPLLAVVPAVLAKSSNIGQFDYFTIGQPRHLTIRLFHDWTIGCAVKW